MNHEGGDETEEEIPLEIEDYSCNTHFERVVGEIERYLVEEFSARQELQRFLVNPLHPPHSCRDNRGTDSAHAAKGRRGSIDGEMVFGRSFFMLPEGGGGGQQEGVATDEGIAVEIHAQSGLQDGQRQRELHPITRFFALPIFFLARGTTMVSSCRPSESSFYLSLLTTAVGRALRGPLSLRFDGDPSCLPSPFFYVDGMAPCFVAVGDKYQLAFKGVAPPVVVGAVARRQTEPWTLLQLVAQPVVRCRFHCSAYPQPPEWCRRVSDLLDMFQLQIGPQSRLQTEVFDGICVSLQRAFRLSVPRRFWVNDYAQTGPAAHACANAPAPTLLWNDVLELENATMVLSAGPMTFPFGTGTPPLRGIDFCFQWNQLLDTEVHDDGGWSSNLGPFAPEGMLLQGKLVIHAVAIPKKECELNHTACKGLSEYVYRVMEHLLADEEVQEEQRCSDDLSNVVHDILFGHTIDPTKQQALVERLATHAAPSQVVKMDIRRVYFPGSFLCRFAHACVNRVHSLDDVLPLWLLAVEQLGSLLEGKGDRRHSLLELIRALGLPDVEEIDHGLPLVVQKLQLLSYCARRMLGDTSPAVAGQPVDGWDDDMGELVSDHNAGEALAAEGELSLKGFVVSGKRLITNGEPLLEPKTLPTPPCTSDVILMKAKELQTLGTASAGRHTRAWMQSEGLFNDMCAFLYFNRAHEGRVVRFPDFVQWHSPRDFIPPSSDAVATDDDAYLSERMRRHSDTENAWVKNIWWPLWEKATPRSPEEIMAQSFVPHEQARLVIRWMERDLSAARLLLETVHANFTNSLHRILSHRCVEDNQAIAAYAQSKNDAIARHLKDAMRWDDDPRLDSEGLRTTYGTAIREIGEIETCLCAALATERMLGAFHKTSSAPPPPAGEPCTSVEQLVATLASPLAMEADPTELALRAASMNWDVWHRSGIAQRFTADDQNPVTTRLRATCMAERPLNTTACFQQMFAETDETGAFRVALALAEEVL
ncbi:putative outer dynein arm docking complex [Trypanosoma rangeli]|uniref:Rab3 GTPase-activating protein catalytic subunit n=1 Tax=Trypanosoma rangeli TaxID=5698 RepID=A0A3R7NQM0_TRYRA|nr:putative outer dynein arm docking complex [Trypanosoma rangeli]RNF06197.1 putative outer dynein arm docking complex [Trypanosoma rangeli]|eukprot:RNF06197.1 putative outer dynein arm docking complex [Trypanosoma rangeli]